MLYLTGRRRHGGILTIDGKAGSTLFLPEPDWHKEIWEGFRTPFDEARELSGVDQVRPINEFSQYMAASQFQTIVCDHHKVRLSPFLDTLRVEKDEYELECMSKAQKITHDSLLRMKWTKNEFATASLLDLYFTEGGATGSACPPIVSFGKSFVCGGGAEYNGYCSFGMRTFPLCKDLKQLTTVLDGVSSEIATSASKGAFSTLEAVENSFASSLRKEIAPGVGTIQVSTHWIGLDLFDTPSIHNDHQLGKTSAYVISGTVIPADSCLGQISCANTIVGCK